MALPEDSRLLLHFSYAPGGVGRRRTGGEWPKESLLRGEPDSDGVGRLKISVQLAGCELAYVSGMGGGRVKSFDAGWVSERAPFYLLKEKMQDNSARGFSLASVLSGIAKK